MLPYNLKFSCKPPHHKCSKSNLSKFISRKSFIATLFLSRDCRSVGLETQRYCNCILEWSAVCNPVRRDDSVDTMCHPFNVTVIQLVWNRFTHRLLLSED